MAKFNSVTKVWESSKVPFPFQMNTFLGEVILKNLKETPDRVCQIFHDENQELTCYDLRIKSIRVAQNLIKLGIKADDVVSIVCSSSNELTICLYGCILIGAPINPLDVSFTKDDLKQMFRQTLPKIVVCDPNSVSKIRDALSELKIGARIYVTSIDGEKSNFSELLAPTNEDEDNFVSPKFDGRSDTKLFAIMFTSGSTGFPKGFAYTHAHVLFEMHQVPKLMLPTRSLSFCPIFWSPGLTSQISLAFKTSDTLIVSEIFSVERFTEIVKLRNPTDFDESPHHLNLLFQSDFHEKVNHQSLVRITSSGAIHSESLRRKFSEVFPDKYWRIIYGSTETDEISWTAPGEYKDKFSVGSNFFPNMTFKIVDENGQKLGPNERGELCIKQLFDFPGYYKNSEASKAAVDDEKFYKTGDIAFFDERGMLFVVDRKKQIVKCSCYQVNLEEIENLIESIAGVQQVSVVAIPDEDFDNSPAAVVVKDRKFKNLTEKIIADFVLEHLAYYKQLRGGVFFVDKLPETSNGKINKKLVFEIVESKKKLSH